MILGIISYSYICNSNSWLTANYVLLTSREGSNIYIGSIVASSISINILEVCDKICNTYKLLFNNDNVIFS